MHRTDRIADGTFDDLARFESRLDARLHVADIVHGIEDAENIDATVSGALDERLNDIVRIISVADHVLPAEEHLRARLGHGRTQLAEPFPWAFLQIAKTRVERRPTPGLHRPVADLIQLAGDRKHIFGAHPGREQRLMSIAQNRFGDFEFVSHINELAIRTTPPASLPTVLFPWYRSRTSR